MLLISCGEDRTYEYENLTKHNIWMFDLMKDKYLWADRFTEQTWKDYFDRPYDYFARLIKKGDKDNGSYMLIDTLLVDNQQRGYFNHLDSYGIDFVLMQDPTKSTTKSYARIVTVYPNSPAAEAGLHRNDFIETADGFKLTSSSAYLITSGDAHLLVVRQLSVDEATGLCVWTSSREVQLPASRYVEDAPYFIKKFITDSGQRIGYLMCNRLTEYPVERNEVSNKYVGLMDQAFADFKQNGISELILDLRLCNFGSLAMARRLASHIVPASSLSKTFATTFWNERNLDNNEVIPFDASLASSTLGLQRVVILTGSYTKGAAEWAIQGLRYALGEENVCIIGTATAGQEFMTQHLGDYETHLHIYPAVAYVGNGDGDYKSYTDGITPDESIAELDYPDLYEYGDQRERLLNTALELISMNAK